MEVDDVTAYRAKGFSAGRLDIEWRCSKASISTGGGFLYQTDVMDLCDEHTVGLNMGHRFLAVFVLNALSMSDWVRAVARRCSLQRLRYAPHRVRVFRRDREYEPRIRPLRQLPEEERLGDTIRQATALPAKDGSHVNPLRQPLLPDH